MDIVIITGNVNFNITLDPSVWIFDDRKVELKSFFSTKKEKSKEKETAKSFSSAWEKETSDFIAPPVQSSVKQFKKEALLNSSYGIPFKPFIENAVPTDSAKAIVIHTKDEQTHIVPLSEAFDAILGFSNEGKPLREDGPLHFYYGNGHNKEYPIKNIVKFVVQ